MYIDLNVIDILTPGKRHDSFLLGRRETRKAMSRKNFFAQCSRLGLGRCGTTPQLLGSSKDSRVLKIAAIMMAVVQVCSGMFRYVQVCSGMFRYVQVIRLLKHWRTMHWDSADWQCLPPATSNDPRDGQEVPCTERSVTTTFWGLWFSAWFTKGKHQRCSRGYPSPEASVFESVERIDRRRARRRSKQETQGGEEGEESAWALRTSVVEFPLRNCSELWSSSKVSWSLFENWEPTGYVDVFTKLRALEQRGLGALAKLFQLRTPVAMKHARPSSRTVHR